MLSDMTIRAGVVGCGGIGEQHAVAYANLDEITLAALCDIEVERLKRCGTAVSAPVYISSYEELFANEGLDIVSIFTKAPKHAEVAVAAAEACVHVLCEKPLVIDLASADEMLTACHRAGAHLVVSHQYRFSPSHR